MNKVRIGIVGAGNMGSQHARSLLDGKIKRAELTALCDLNPNRLRPFLGVKHFSDSNKLLRSGAVDAVLIATPHNDHPALGVAGLQHGLHVLIEKPIAVHKADAQQLLAAHRNQKQIFAAMFNQRTDDYYKQIRHLVHSGELGAIRRINWIITSWFRSEAYYASGGWRATWAGEGGGVLLNQAPHNLDLFQWICGQPVRVRAHCRFGHYHPIEVEDDVTAYVEFANGATGTFITSTGEAPGTNRLEIAGELGRLVYENDALSFRRNAVPTSEFSRTTTEAFAAPPCEDVVLERPADHGPQHLGILRNFADAIHHGAPLLAPAAEGVASLELANAMLLSTWLDRTIELPLDAELYARELERRKRS
jgi:predicted dehydrogenase